MAGTTLSRCSDLISIINQGLECREESLISAHCDQDVFERINVMSNNPAKELSQAFDKRRVALRRQSWLKMSRIFLHVTWKYNASPYKGPCVLMHGRPSTYCFTKGILDKLGRREIRESLSKIDGFVVGSQLWEFHPDERNQIGCFSYQIDQTPSQRERWLQARVLSGHWKAKNQCEVIQ